MSEPAPHSSAEDAPSVPPPPAAPADAAALPSLQQRAETILESIGEMFLALDADWRFTYINRRTERIWHLLRDDLIGRRLTEVFPQLDGSEALNHLQTAMRERRSVRFETVSPILGRWVDSAVYPTDDGGICVYFRDIDSRKRIEGSLRLFTESLHKSEERYRRLLETALEGVLFIDADANITYVNQRLAAMLGYERPEELIGRDAFFILPAEDVPWAKERWEARQMGVQEEFELRLRRRDDSACWTIAHVSVEQDEKGGFAGTFTMLTDITERRRVERELAARNAEIIALYERVTDGFAAFDHEWRFTYVNTEGERILGRSRGTLVGKCIWDEFEGARESLVYEEYQRAAREQVSVAFEMYYGPLFGWFEVRGYPSPTGFSAFFHDISERKKTEIERERAAEEKARLVAELEEAALRQRRFLREMLSSLTEGRLRLCDRVDQLPPPLPDAAEDDPVDLDRPSLKTLRRRVEAAAERIAMPPERAQDLLTAVGEAAMNAVVHAGGGRAEVRFDGATGAVQVWIRDEGRGIAEEAIHRATLEKGYSSTGTLGHGFWMMLKTTDRLYLLTGPEGTTVVLEEDRTPAPPSWLLSFGDGGLNK